MNTSRITGFFSRLTIMDTKDKHLLTFILGQVLQIVLSVIFASLAVQAVFASDHPVLKQLGFLAILGDFKFMAGLAMLVWVHEMSHMALFHRYGVPTFGLIFPPIGGIMVTGKKTTPFQTLIVALAGPMSGLAAIPMIVYGAWQNQPLWIFLALIWSGINLLNLAPIFPLDGGWVLKNILIRWLPEKTATRISWGLTIIFVGLMLWLVPDKRILIIQFVLTGMMVVMDFFATKTFKWFSNRYKEEDMQEVKTTITTEEVSQGIAMYFALVTTLALVVWLSIIYLPGL